MLSKEIASCVDNLVCLWHILMWGRSPAAGQYCRKWVLDAQQQRKFWDEGCDQTQPLALMSWGASLAHMPHTSVEMQQKKLNMTLKSGIKQVV